MSDYHINFTDPTKGSFVIKPYTRNGMESPLSVTPLVPQALAANTSLVLMGKGMWDYGEYMQENLVHLLENFASPSTDGGPKQPLVGQLWYESDTHILKVYDGTVWQQILTSAGGVGADIDLNNMYRVINMLDPVNPQDGVTLSYASATYVDAAGDTMTGTLGVPTVDVDDLNVFASLIVDAGVAVDFGGNTLTNANDPVNPTDVATKQYVDNNTVASIDNIGDVVITGVNDGEVLTHLGGTWINLPPIVDADFTTPPTVGNVLTYNGTKWVAGASAGAGDYVVSGIMNGTTMELTRLLGGVVSVTNVAPADHTHDDIDQAIEELRQPFGRTISDGDGATLTFGAPPYLTYGNRLYVTVDGLKKYMSTRGTVSLNINSPQATINDHTGLDSSTTYDVQLRVNTTGAPTTVSLTPTDTVVNLLISGVDDTIDTFYVNGNYETTFAVGRTFTVAGSTGNDGTWTVTTSSFDGVETLITVAEDVTDATNDGTIDITQITFESLVDQLQVAIDILPLPVNVKFINSTIQFIPDQQGRTGAIEMLDGSGTDPLIAALQASYTGTGVSYTTFGSAVGINAADNTADTFEVSGNYTAMFTAGTRFVVNFSSGGDNDGLYEVDTNASFGSGVTTIPVTTSITTNETSGNGTGILYFARTLDYEENGTPLDPASKGNLVVFTSAPTAGAIIEAIVAN